MSLFPYYDNATAMLSHCAGGIAMLSDSQNEFGTASSFPSYSEARETRNMTKLLALN